MLPDRQSTGQKRRIGKLVLTQELLLAMLDYRDGSVLAVDWGIQEDFPGVPMVAVYI